jgi:hypothetical protein
MQRRTIAQNVAQLVESAHKKANRAPNGSNIQVITSKTYPNEGSGQVFCTRDRFEIDAFLAAARADVAALDGFYDPIDRSRPLRTNSKL